jgi:hypothetical protein
MECAGLLGLMMAGLLSTGAAAIGAVSPYTDEASFFATGLVQSTETFDEFPHFTVLPNSAEQIDKITYTAGDPSSVWIAGIHMGIPGYVSAPNDFGTNNIDENTLSFGADFVHAIGFYFSTGGIFPQPTYIINVTTTSGAVYSDHFSLTSGSVYRGYTAPEGIGSVTIADDPLVIGAFNWGLDNVSRSAIVPEPASFALSLFSLLSIARRRGGRFV